MDILENLGPQLQHDVHDDQAVLRNALSLLDADNEGWALEFGVGAGGTLRMIAERLPVIGFDSFEGLPEDWRPEYPKGSFALQDPKRDRIPQVENATVVVGLFADTLPGFDWPDKVDLIHFDADLFSSTATALEHCGHLIKPGTLVVFDEFFGYDGAHEHEQRAWSEWTKRHGVEYEALGHGREQVLFWIQESVL